MNLRQQLVDRQISIVPLHIATVDAAVEPFDVLSAPPIAAR